MPKSEARLAAKARQRGEKRPELLNPTSLWNSDFRFPGGMRDVTNFGASRVRQKGPCDRHGTRRAVANRLVEARAQLVMCCKSSRELLALDWLD